MFANTQMMGLDTAFPDVCMTPATPPIPVTYPNIALGPTATSGIVWHVLMGCAPTHNLATKIPITNGDNPGVLLGVVSGTVMGQSRHLTGAFTCIVDGMPITRLTSVSLQNSTNMVGMRTVPSQTKVLVLKP